MRWALMFALGLGTSPGSQARYIAVAAGRDQTCAHNEKGAIECVGKRGSGDNRLPPQGEFTAISVRGNLACAVEKKGGLACWGTQEEVVGRAVPPEGSFTGVVVSPRNLGFPSVQALDDKGRIHICHFEESEQGRGFSCSRIELESLFPVVAVASGPDFSCSLDSGGAIRCDKERSFIPKDLPGRFAGLAAGDSFLCTLGAKGDLACWGEGWRYRELRNDNRAELDRFKAKRFKAISAGGGLVCALDEEGAAWCWGRGWAPVGTPAGRFTAIAVGEGGHACALDDRGAIQCWGDNEGGKANPPGEDPGLALRFVSADSLEIKKQPPQVLEGNETLALLRRGDQCKSAAPDADHALWICQQSQPYTRVVGYVAKGGLSQEPQTEDNLRDLMARDAKAANQRIAEAKDDEARLDLFVEAKRKEALGLARLCAFRSSECAASLDLTANLERLTLMRALYRSRPGTDLKTILDSAPSGKEAEIVDCKEVAAEGMEALVPCAEKGFGPGVTYRSPDDALFVSVVPSDPDSVTVRSGWYKQASKSLVVMFKSRMRSPELNKTLGQTRGMASSELPPLQGGSFHSGAFFDSADGKVFTSVGPTTEELVVLCEERNRYTTKKLGPLLKTVLATQELLGAFYFEHQYQLPCAAHWVFAASTPGLRQGTLKRYPLGVGGPDLDPGGAYVGGQRVRRFGAVTFREVASPDPKNHPPYGKACTIEHQSYKKQISSSYGCQLIFAADLNGDDLADFIIHTGSEGQEVDTLYLSSPTGWYEVGSRGGGC